MIALVGVMSGCSTANYIAYNAQQMVNRSGLVGYTQLQRGKNTLLPTNTRLYIAVSDDLIQQYRQYHATSDSENITSGSEMGQDDAVIQQAELLSQQLTGLLRDAASQNFIFVKHGNIAESVDYALTRADYEATDILVYPRISHYRNGVGTWTEIGRLLRRGSSEQITEGVGFDEIQLELLILDVSTQQMVDSVRMTAESGLLTLYGDHPLDLLKPSADELFTRLAGRI